MNSKVTDKIFKSMASTDLARRLALALLVCLLTNHGQTVSPWAILHYPWSSLILPCTCPMGALQLTMGPWKCQLVYPMGTFQSSMGHCEPKALSHAPPYTTHGLLTMHYIWPMGTLFWSMEQCKGYMFYPMCNRALPGMVLLGTNKRLRL